VAAPGGLPPRVRKLKGFLGPRSDDGRRTLYTTDALDEGVYVREVDVLRYSKASRDADGLKRDVLVVPQDAVIVRWFVEEQRQDSRRRRGGDGIDDGNRLGIG
jgi:hypothetical protein